VLHIDLPTRADIEALATWRGAPAVSIYLATTPVTQNTDVDRIELKNLLKSAIGELEAAGTPKRAIWPIEQAVAALIADDAFWTVQARSLAVFVTPERIRTFRLPNRLVSVVEVADRFLIKPLIRSVTFPQDAYVLAVSMGGVRLVEVDAELPPHEVKVPGLPKDMASALGRSSHGERTGPGTSGQEQSEHALLTRYARSIDQALRPVLAGHGRPLIVAATEPLASVYRAISTYPHTAEAVIGGNADRAPDRELAAEARKVLDGIYASDIEAVAALYVTREAQGRATTDVAQAAKAATFGAVDTLVVDMDEVLAGTVDDETGAVTFGEPGKAETYGVVDEIARRTLLAGGRVVSARRADVPGGGDVAAILRYAV
jgi:hypothetical protein